MKILFWADGFWPRIGGTETQGFQFVKGMQERGHECLVLTQKYASQLPDEEIFQGLRIKRLNFNPIIQQGAIKILGPIKECLQKIRIEFPPDIIYLNTLENGSVFVFLLFHKIFNAPTVLTIHTPYYKDILPSLIKQICGQVEHVCTASKWAYRVMKNLLPSLKNPLKMIYYGLSTPKIEPSPLPFTPSTILLLGRLSWEKGFDTAIIAFSLLKKKGFNTHLIIAGDGPERRTLQNLVDQLDLKDSVQFTGEILRDSEVIFSLINQSTFVVMPSLFEAFGLVALEAMQMGRPVIASDIGGLPEIVSHKELGLLVPLGKESLGKQEKKNQTEDADILCHAMETLLENREETQQMGLRARQWAIKTYLLEENLNQYEELFKQCLLQPIL